MLNLRESEDRKIYVSSDFHLNHDPKWTVPIWKMRGFDSAKAMTDGIIDSVNEVVRPNDTLLFLGDFCLNTPLDVFNSFLDRIKCQNIMALWGNHNNPHEKSVYHRAMASEGTEVYPFKYKNMTYLGYYAEVVLGGQYAVLCHYPIYVWNEMQHGAWMLCGHSHCGCDLTKAESLYGKILDVGWDGPRKPWSISEIAAVMNGKRFVAVDHHHPAIVKKEEQK